MLEGVIHRVLVGYLGPYIKDFHKHQLKLSLWNEEVFLENVELIPEALDFLQLPFSLKHGRIGRLSIQVSWKKLVWDYSNTFFVVLQDVFVCASPRHVHEWDPDAVEKREFAGKKAKLAAAELEKLSRRVCDNRTGKWFLSFIMAKILKSIRVTIRNFHVQFCGEQSIPVLFGLKFSSLVVKQSSKRASEKELALQGDKNAEDEGLAFVKCDIEEVMVYCLEFDADLINEAVEVNSDVLEVVKFDPMVHPFGVFLSITMNKVGELLPQYSLKAELNELRLSLSEIQILQILNLIDFFNTGHLREKYGRYRPWSSPLSSKLQGWQKLWWRYAQESVLSDVRRKLNKSSWRCLGNRLIYRRKYINFYKRKLELLQKEQSPDEVVLEELEQVERQCDVDEILNFRSVAESELKEVLSSTGSTRRVSESNPSSVEKRSTGWLNWLSRGLLGAGGTSDIGQFAGAVSDEVVKDIYEATEFHPDIFPSPDIDSSVRILFLALEFKIILISAQIWNRKCNEKIADLVLSNSAIECKFWEDITASVFTIKSLRLLYQDNIIFQVEQPLNEKVATEVEIASSGVQVNVSSNFEAELLIKVNLGEIESTCDLKFFLRLVELFNALKNFKFFHQRVLRSLDGIEDAKTRLSSKAEYVLSIHKNFSWDVYICRTTVNIPFERSFNELLNFVFLTGNFHITSKYDDGSSDLYFKEPYCLNQFADTNTIMTSLLKFGEVNLFNLFCVEYEEIELSFFKCGEKSLILEKFGGCMFGASSIIEDRLILENLEIFVLIPTIRANVGVYLFEAGQALYKYLTSEMSKYEASKSSHFLPRDNLQRSAIYGLTVATNIKDVVVCVNLKGTSKSDVNIALNQLHLWYSNIKFEECCFWINSAEFVTSSFRNENDRHLLISCGNAATPSSTLENYVLCGFKPENIDYVNGCYILHFESYSCSNLVYQKLSVELNDADLHCHPYIFGLIARFGESIASLFSSIFIEDVDHGVNDASYIHCDSNLSSDIEGVLSNLSAEFFEVFKLKERDCHSPARSSSPGQLPCPKVSGCLFSAEIGIRRIKVHFHDNCCAIGTINLPRAGSSLIIYKSLMDFIITVDGMTVTTSVSSSSLREVCWFPLSNLTPVISIRIRKQNGDSSSVDLIIRIQKVCCIVPSETLPVLIGYFCLPEWSSNDALLKRCPEQDGQKEMGITLSIEMLDSVLLLPLEHHNYNFIKITFQNLHFCLYFDADPGKALENIPIEIRVSADKLHRSYDCINVSGRNLVASYVTCPHEHDFNFWKGIQKDSVTFISNFSADVWIRIPCLHEPVATTDFSSVMAKISNCQILIDDGITLLGIFALRDIITRLLEIEKGCKSYAGDVSQFFKKINLKNNQEHSSDTSVVLAEIKCCLDSLSIQLYDCNSAIPLAEPLFVAYLGLMLVASLENDHLRELNIRYPTVNLLFVRDSLVLFKGFSNVSFSSDGFVHYMQCVGGRHEMEVSLPSVDIIFELSAWITLYDVVNSYAIVVSGATKEYLRSTSLQNCAENKRVTHIIFSMLSKPCSTNVKLRIPVRLFESTNSESRYEGKHEVRYFTQHNILEVTALIRGVDFLVLGEEVRMQASLEDLTLAFGSHENDFTSTYPLIIISNLDMIVDNALGKLGIYNIDMHSKDIDLRLSDRTLYFLILSNFDFSDVHGSHSLSSNVDIKLRVQKVSLTVSDESWSCSGPLLEAVMTECLVHVLFFQNNLRSSIKSNVQMNYNNIHKVAWEPLVEPWKLQIEISLKHDLAALRNSLMMTEIQLLSMEQLNINFTESSVECIARLVSMCKRLWNSGDAVCQSKAEYFPKRRSNVNLLEERSAPYKLHNLTSLPLIFHHFNKKLSSAELKGLEMDSWTSAQPGAVIPMLLNDAREDASSISSKGSNNYVSHRFMAVQLDGMSYASICFSIDVVGRTYFEADFSKSPSPSDNYSSQVLVGTDTSNSFSFPVVVDVSIERYSKVVRLSSTVVLHNLSRIPLQLRFDIPFGVEPKVLDPLFPGEEYPVPLHLAEVGRMRCRPYGNSYLWSELHDLSSIISPNIVGFHRPFVSYPSLPSNHPFRCCVFVEKLRLPPPLLSTKRGDGLPRSVSTDQILVDYAKERYTFQVKLCAPLIIKSYLPGVASLTLKSGGVVETVAPMEVELSFHHVDPAHDVDIEFSIPGYKQSFIKFPRAESYSNMNTPGLLTLVDNIMLYREISGVGSNDICISVEKVIHVSSGSRELSFFAPLLLYNCMGLHLNILEALPDGNGSYWTVPSSYEWQDFNDFRTEKHSLHLLLSDQATSNHGSVKRNASLHTLHRGKSTELRYSETYEKYENVKPIMFSPTSSIKDLIIQVRKCPSGTKTVNSPRGSWSAPFLVVAPSASSTVLIPEPSSLTNSAYVMSVTCSALDGPLSGKSQAIVMQPRYVICNACSKSLLFKQKRSGVSSYLEVGKHSSLVWTETARELLVTVCFDESGWQWSGSFLPDHLGDTQVKMRNYDGSYKMIRVEVVNSDTFFKNEMLDRSIGENSGTNLVFLSEDSIGFVPYRIDNLSKEKLRIYQQKCESSDTVVPPYACIPYSWDEPYYPHRLVVEVPGERIVGSYDLDNVKDAIPVHLQRTTEKSERTLLISVHAEGAIKVLRIIDSSFHYFNKQKCLNSPLPLGDQMSESYETSNVKFVALIHSIGISVMNDSPLELVFACAKGISFEMLEKMEQHKVSLRISSIQIDNQLCGTNYPVILFFNEHNPVPRIADDALDPKFELLSHDSDNAPALSVDVATLRKSDISLVSFEYIIFRVANFQLELDQNFIWNLLDFTKSVSSRFQNQSLIHADFNDRTCVDGADSFVLLDAKEHHKVKCSNSTYFSAKKSLPSVVPIGAPWQKLCQSAGTNAKIYVQSFYVAPIEFSLSFSSSPWGHRNSDPTLGTFSFLHRGLMALADVEGAQIQLNQFTLSHKTCGFDSWQNLLARHYYRQLLREMYKVFGSAGVIGNPIGFARSMGHGIRDFMTVPSKTLFKSPSGLLMGMAQGTTSLVSNTVYAFSDATTQFTKAAQKGIVAITPNDHPSSSNQEGAALQSKGVVHEVLEGLTGLLQYPVKEVEKHGLPGVISGVALGLTGLLARPAASILEVAGKTAQSIKNKSMIYQKGTKPRRMRFLRPLRRNVPLKPYSWEEAIGLSILRLSEHAANQNEDLLLCKALKQAGKYIVITERLMLIVFCPDLVELGKDEFKGVAEDLKCLYEMEISLDSLIHVDAVDAVVHLVGSHSDASLRPNQRRSTISANSVPLFHNDLELTSSSDAGHLLRIVVFAIEQGKARGWGTSQVLHRYTLPV